MIDLRKHVDAGIAIETALVQIKAELHSAVIQSSPSDDQIIMEHVRAAYALADFTLQYMRKAERTQS